VECRTESAAGGYVIVGAGVVGSDSAPPRFGKTHCSHARASALPAFIWPSVKTHTARAFLFKMCAITIKLEYLLHY